MQVTFTNASGSDVAVGALYTTLAAGASVTTSMTASQFDGEQQLKTLVEDGTLTIALVVEAGDGPMLHGMSAGNAYDDAGRPAATAVPPFTSIWNTDDGTPNWSDGTAWIGMDGLPT